jgi:hypothetical protein
MSEKETSLKDVIQSEMEALNQKADDIKKVQRDWFSTAFVHYFHEHPGALLFVCGQTGEYSDEGYSGTWIARVDPEHMDTIDKSRKKSKRPPMRDEENQQKLSTKIGRAEIVDEQMADPWTFRFRNWLPENPENYALSAFAPFERAWLLNETFEKIGQGGETGDGRFWDATHCEDLVGWIGSDYKKIVAQVESESLKESSGVSGVEKKKRKAKAL